MEQDRFVSIDARNSLEIVHPLLLVDVDGVISLFGFEMDARPTGHWLSVDGIPHFLSADAGRHLRDLSEVFELVWCTGWEEKANEYLPALLGLPSPLPWLSFDARVDLEDGTQPAPAGLHGHWKLDAIVAYVGARPLAWIDDAHDDECREWAAARSAPTLLVTTEPHEGLVARHADQLRTWAARLASWAADSGE